MGCSFKFSSQFLKSQAGMLVVYIIMNTHTVGFSLSCFRD